MLSETIQRLSGQRAACKQWSTALAVVILLAGALGRLDAASLLWAAAPLLLLGLAEAGYTAQERRCAELLKNRKGNGENAVVLPEAAGASIAGTASAVLSLSIWPFYLGMFTIVAAGSGMLAPTKEDAAHRIVHTAASTTTAKAGCGSGGCGSAGGCGNGGCGASAGKSCSCGGGAPKVAAQRSVQQPLQTTMGPRPLSAMTPRPAIGPANQFRQLPITPPTSQPGAPPVFQSPLRSIKPGPVSVPPQPAPSAPAQVPAAPGPAIE